MANTVVDTRNRKGEVVVKFLNGDEAEGAYKLIEVEQVGARMRRCAGMDVWRRRPRAHLHDM